MARESREQIDRWLDAALKEYSNAEPRSGLEGRALARLRAEQEAPVRSWSLRWPFLAIATPAALAIVMFLVEQLGPIPPAPVARVVTAPSAVKTPTAGNLQIMRTRHLQDNRRDAPATNPKREQFPSPAPLTEQEQILAQYVDEHFQHAVLVARAQADLALRDNRADALSNELRYGSSSTNREKEGIQ
jgi:hypothetical protein